MNKEEIQINSSVINGQIYQNILQPSFKAVDISMLEDNFGIRLVEQLTTKAGFQIDAKAVYAVDEQIRTLYFDARYYEKAKGTHVFGLGYPLFCSKTENGETIISPVLIWELGIEPSVKHNEGWKIIHHELDHVYVNPFLSDLWNTHHEFDLDALINKHLRSEQISKQDLIKFCNALSEKLKLESSADQLNVEPVPVESSVDEEASLSRISYSGIIGNFTYNHFLPNATTSLKQETDLPPIKSFSPVHLNPVLTSAFRKVQENTISWINGKEGTGKIKVGMHTLLGALSAGQHCLVVANNTGSLHQYQDMLVAMGLERLTYLLRNTPQDKALFLEIIKASMSAKTRETDIDKRQFEIEIERAERQHQKLEQSYRSTRKKIFRSHNWTDTVGLYLSSIRLEGKELLGTQVNASDYEFTDQEYSSLRLDIADCYSLFKDTDTLRSPLNKLNSGVFLRMEQEEAQQFVSEKLDTLLEKGGRIRRWYISRMDAYADALTAHYEHYYQQYTTRLIALKEQLADHLSTYGEDFSRKSQRSLRLRGVFSSNARTMADAQQKTIADYEQLHEQFEKNAYFDYTFPKQSSVPGIKGVQNGLNNFESALQKWRLQQRDIVQEELARLSRKTVQPKLNFSNQIEELEEGLNGFTAQINESGLYHLPFHNKTLTTPKQQRFLEDIIEQLEETQSALSGFGNFYNWQNNWLRLDAKSRRLINVLVKVKPKNWTAAFESWFMDNLLSKHYEAILPHSIEDVKALGEMLEKLSSRFVPYMNALWQPKQEHAFKNLKRSNKGIYQELLRSDYNSDSFSSIFTKGLSLISTAVPALLTTPELLTSALKTEGKVFDLVLVNEAQELSAEEVKYICSLGKRCVLMGVSTPVLSPPAEVLVKKLGGASIVLNDIITDFPAHLYQAVQNMEKGEPLRWQTGSTHFEQLGGRYDAQSETNEEEALRIISLLNDIKKTPQRTYPSVGIICMTKGQRNLISSYILGIKQRRSTGVEVIQQLERNGMMILTLEELAGHQFDTLIVSATYGVVDLEANMSDHVYRLDDEKAIIHLQRLMGSGKDKLFFLNSVSEELLDEIIRANDPSGTLIFALYTRFLTALQTQDTETIEGCVQQMSTQMPVSDENREPVNFLEEVRAYLSQYLGTSRLEINTAGLTPFLVHPDKANDPAVALLPDGFWSQEYTTDIRWEYEKLKSLEAYNILPFMAISANWWRSPDQEARKMASRIIQQESKELTKAAPMSEEEE